MNPQELRIGNYILTDDGVICEVSQLESKEFTQWDSGNSYSIVGKKIGTEDNYKYCEEDNWEGIPITEEWMIRLGFEKTPKGWINKSYYMFSDGIWYFKIKAGSVFLYMGDEFIQIFKYVHQLQNIYHALTQQELILTTNTIKS